MFFNKTLKLSSIKKISSSSVQLKCFWHTAECRMSVQFYSFFYKSFYFCIMKILNISNAKYY